jgi:O-antigen/teichoic acid export membrane protein
MSESKKLLHGTMVLILGQVISYGLSFVRNIILARMLAKADFGLAAIFAMTLSLLEIAGRMSFGQQLIQAKDGDSAPFQATSQAFQFVLSVSGAILILGLSHPLAHAFKMPQLTWAFASLAAVPLARGFEHLDYFRQQRELNYLPAVLCELVPQLIVTLAAWPLAAWLGDFRVMVWLMIGKAGLGILMTHWVARRPYRWAWRVDYLKLMWLFGWPLLLNGLLMFASQQADQLLVGSFLSLADLGAYALALSLVSIPWFVFGQVGTSIMLPILSRVREDPEQFRRQYRVCLEYAAVGAVLLTLPFIIAGEQLVTLFYGSKYAGTGILMAILSAAVAVRFLRYVPAVAATARADTMNQLYSNLFRGSGLVLAAIVALSGYGVAAIAACAVVGELLAALISLLRLRQCQEVPLQDSARAVAYVLCFLSLGLLLVYLGAAYWRIWFIAAIMLALLPVSMMAAWLLFPALAQTLRDAILVKWSPPVQQPATN